MKHTFTLAFFLLLSVFCTAQTFTEEHTVNCGENLVITGLGYPTWNDPEIIVSPQFGYAQLIGDLIPPNAMDYTAPPCFVGRDSIVIRCAHATQITCDTGIYIINITCAETATYTIPVQTGCTGTFSTAGPSAWLAPSIASGPAHGTAVLQMLATDGTILYYTPQPGYEGLDMVKVGLTGSTVTYLYLFQVTCNFTNTVSNQPEAKALSVTPQPASTQADLSGWEGVIESVDFLSVDGKTHADITYHLSDVNQLSFSFNGIPTGIYIVLLHTSKGFYHGKLVVSGH